MFRDREGWRVQWFENGKRRSKKFGSQKDARKFELELELGVADTSARQTSPTFEAFAVRWLQEYCLVQKRETSWEQDRRVIEIYLKPAFGELRLAHLSSTHLNDVKVTMTEKVRKNGKPLSPRTINFTVGLAKAMMNFAVDMGLLDANPFRSVKRVKQPKRQPDFWLPEERDEFTEKATPLNREFAELVLVACHTGLRMGELAALTRSKLSFDRRKIMVDGTFNQKVAKRFPTKNGESQELPMNDLVYRTLSPKRFLQADAAVFPRHLFHNCRRQFARLCEATGVRPIRFHDLRHTFASTLAMAGVDLMVIQRLMRHKSYQMTLRYAHLPPEHLAGITEILCTQSARRENEPKGEAVKT